MHRAQAHADVFRAIADPTRRAILDRLRAGAGAILASVEIAAPTERVFRAITDPRELKEWWGSPETYHADRWEADLRVGGAWRVEGHGAQGKPYSVYGEYLVIEPPRRLVLT